MAGATTKLIGGSWGCLPEERAKIFCNQGDGVCGGAFSISGAHLSYTSNGDINKGVEFAMKIINGGKLGPPTDGCKFSPSASELQAKFCSGGGPPGGGPPKGGPPKGGPKSMSALFRRQAKGGKGSPAGEGVPKFSCPPKMS
jgi:hypothetical protein